MAADIHEQLTKYITDAHSIEVQALAQLDDAPEAAKEPGFEQALREHRKETERHERLTRQLLDNVQDRSVVVVSSRSSRPCFARLRL